MSLLKSLEQARPGQSLCSQPDDQDEEEKKQGLCQDDGHRLENIYLLLEANIAEAECLDVVEDGVQHDVVRQNLKNGLERKAERERRRRERGEDLRES